MVGEGEDAVGGDDEVVADADVDETEGVAEAACDALVGRAGLCDTRGVVVEEDDGGSVMGQGGLDDFAGINGGAVESAAEEILDGDEAVTDIEVEDAEDLVVEVGDMEGEEVAS